MPADVEKYGGNDKSGSGSSDRKWTKEPQSPFASSEVEMPLGLGATSMGVSTSLDTSGNRGRSPSTP